jgi:hypothetical protein
MPGPMPAPDAPVQAEFGGGDGVSAQADAATIEPMTRAASMQCRIMGLGLCNTQTARACPSMPAFPTGKARDSASFAPARTVSIRGWRSPS